jgi:hypothetical protein
VPLLAQQELLEPPPTRRLAVPAGRTAWWGADLGTTRLALAYIAQDGSRGSCTVPFPVGKGSARLSAIYAYTRLGVAAQVRHGWPAPGVLMTEQPSGSKRSVNLPFIMACGAIHAGLFDGLVDVLGSSCVIEETVASHWKLVACGMGNISKPQKEKGKQRPALTDYRVFRWALASGWSPMDWNECDAAGMAECARREIALVER